MYMQGSAGLRVCPTWPWRLLRWVLPCLLTVCAFSAADVNAQYRFDHFTTNEGLPQNTVSAITQTHDGYLWFATYAGLVRYDGIRFTVFDKGNVDGIASNQFLALYEDYRGTLWAGTGEGGMIRYKDRVFTTFNKGNGLPADYVGRMQRAENDKTVIFVENGNKNYLKWPAGDSPVAVNIFEWTDKNSAIPVDTRLLTEFSDRAKSRWIIQPGKLIRVKNNHQFDFPVPIPVDELIRFHFEDRAGNMWIGTRDNGVFRITGDTLTHYTDQNGLPMHVAIRVAGDDGQGNIWLFSDTAVFRYRDGQFTSYDAQTFFHSKLIRSVFCDREGTIWVGTNDVGLFRLTRKFLVTYAPSDGLPDKIVYPIFQDTADNIWFSSGGVLTLYKNGRFTAYPLVRDRGSKKSPVSQGPVTEDQSQIYVLSLAEDRDGRLMIGSNAGLFFFKDGHLVDTPITLDTPIMQILQDHNGDIWMGTGFGLFRYRDGVVTKYNTKNGLPDERINLIYQDRQNRLWIGTKGGLARLDGDRFVSFTTREGLVGNRIRCIYQDADGTLWIGTTDSGISRLKDGRFTNYSTRNGLYNNGAFQILEGEHDYFWISSNRGIYRVSRKQLNDFADHKISVINSVAYGVQDGMLSVECNGERQPAGTRASDGKLWFPTQDGVVVIDPKMVPYNSHLPLLSIESTTLDGNVVNFTNGVLIEPGQSDFEISYSAPSSIKPEYIHFKYRLAGLDNDWIDGGTQHTVRYAHLPPGKYTFRVIAANSDGIWNDGGASFDLDVRPFFYETRLFLVLCGFILAGLAATGYAVRVRQLKGNEKRLTTLVDQRTAELVKKTQQLEVANDKLEKLATLDGLTNIANHRRFQDFLSHEWQRSQRQQTPISLLLMDVDFFKLYNDTYGHQGGDECLKQVARVLGETVKRATDLAARYGGEEFAIILSDTDDTGALAIAESVRSQIESLRVPHAASKVNEYVTLSIGVATAIPDIDTGQDSLIAAADQALYVAKEKGRNRCEAKFARRSLIGVS